MIVSKTRKKLDVCVFVVFIMLNPSQSMIMTVVLGLSFLSGFFQKGQASSYLLLIFTYLKPIVIFSLG